MANKTIPTVRVLAVAGSAGVQTLVAASIFCRYLEAVECPPNGGAFDGTNFAPQGLNYQRADDGYTATYGLVNADVLAFGDKQFARDRGIGVPPRTDPTGAAIAGTPFVKLKSATATGTYIQISEWP